MKAKLTLTTRNLQYDCWDYDDCNSINNCNDG